jgi:hypothetical protein
MNLPGERVQFALQSSGEKPMSSEGKNASDRLKHLFAVGPELANHIETTICNIELQFGRQTKLSDLDWTSPETPYLMDYIEKGQRSE